MNANEWMAIADSYIGTKEIAGPSHEPKIVTWLRDLKAWWSDDETPWCGVFVAAVMQKAGVKRPRMYMRAKEWLNWGATIQSPLYGCIVVLERNGGGHVGFLVGISENGDPWILGGNQTNEVTVAKFKKDRVLGYRVPFEFSFASSHKPRLMLAKSHYSNHEV